ncbi:MULTISPECIES: ABC transporter permease [unclassified Actinomyces]|uniref:ABC transporter permease n=1 Tax=unclassified Actinomyces TaxID=2609248 RepID=UPI000D59B69E|nr:MULTISPECIES: ABC transporter permease [unclassified Actinomyces]RAX22862.1 ABC transporter permease [Actinomyces sp. Z3]
MLSIVRSELTKTLTLPSVWIMTLLLTAVLLLFQFQSFTFNHELVANLRGDGTSEVDGLLVVVDASVFTDYVAYIFNPAILTPLLGAVIAGAEFRTGQFGMSVLAVPDRGRLLAGKLIAVALQVLTLGVIWIGAAKALLHLAVRDSDALAGGVWSPSLPLADARILLFMVAATVFIYALTLIARKTLVGVIVTVLLIMVTMTQVLAFVSPAVDALMPFSAARNLVLAGGDVAVPLTGSPARGAAVLLGWAVASCVAAVAGVLRRDA